MKRIIALISLLVCLNSTNSFTAFSVSNAADLSAIASSLGADTDYFYNTSIAYSVPDFVQSPEFPINYNSENYAISVLQVLVHNGLISASDIQPGAEVLNDITPSDTVNSLVQSYRLSGIDKKIEMAFGNTYCNTSQEEMVNKLISTAETSMADGKYFVVAVKLANTDNGAHAMVGIGIADGNWTYNNKTYDKCILTLDPDTEIVHHTIILMPDLVRTDVFILIQKLRNSTFLQIFVAVMRMTFISYAMMKHFLIIKVL